MADLIIKPNSATGDKLILQDRAGGAVMTTADSGATIANATLNSPTLVTPALGTPASGVVTNLSGVLPAGVTGGSGLTNHGRIGKAARSYLTNTIQNLTGANILTGYTNDWNQDTDIFEHHANGLKVKIAGTYLITWSLYSYSQSSGSINPNYSQEHLAFGLNSGNPDTHVHDTYIIWVRTSHGHADRYHKRGNAHILPLAANTVMAHRSNVDSGTYRASGGADGTFLVMTYLSDISTGSGN